jgi:CRISPR-associated endonuclease/helicase Cas3
MSEIDFTTAFRTLTGMTKPEEQPFPWQRDLYDNWFSKGQFPDACVLPTGLGKTCVIAVWLIAMANAKPVPRRLVYVVNRRTVVDQTTDEVVKYRGNLAAARITEPLAISTLRGQHADNREWSADPSRPAVICGTVDMIGSRLLFSGYGVGFKGRPLHAGFLGQDVLLVHDEAHLEPAFQDLLVAIQEEQKRCKDFRPLRVMELTATSRGGGKVFPNDEERARNEADPVVQRRIGAKKKIEFYPVDDEKAALVKVIVARAKARAGHEAAVLVFVRSVERAGEIASQLGKAFPDRVEQLNGTLRGYERDNLIERPVFQRFLPHASRDTGEPAFLVCTSAGEVGVNISADHLVCDLTTFDSAAQRFGRVNRFGEPADQVAHIDIVHPEFDKDDKLDDIDRRRQRTLDLLRMLNGDGSPAALREIHRKAMQEGSGTGPMSTDRTEVLRKYILSTYAPPPTTLPTSDILFDAWALTTIPGKLPGRPAVEPYLHGISEYDPPQTAVAWREEVELLTPEVLAQSKLKPEDILDLYPLKPHEELSGPTNGKNKVFEQLEQVAARDAKREADKRLSAWVIAPDGSVTVYPLGKLVDKDRQNKPVVQLGGQTVILPPHAGGFSGGLLKGDEPFAEAINYDVSHAWYADAAKSRPRRIRVWEGDGRFEEETKGMRLIRRIDFPAGRDDEDAVGRSWYWFTLPDSADDDASKTARQPITWDHHTSDVVRNAKRIADALLKDRPDLHAALIAAAKFHDLGKKRELWQRSIGNPTPTDWHAKSGRNWKPREITDYRHEFGSLLDVMKNDGFCTESDQLPSDEARELVLHLIAVHHGRGRPHFPADEVFDPDHHAASWHEIAREVPRRFARLQRQYGRWGLAYLESLLRAADIEASAHPSPLPGEVTDE